MSANNTKKQQILFFVGAIALLLVIVGLFMVFSKPKSEANLSPPPVVPFQSPVEGLHKDADGEALLQSQVQQDKITKTQEQLKKQIQGLMTSENKLSSSDESEKQQLQDMVAKLQAQVDQLSANQQAMQKNGMNGNAGATAPLGIQETALPLISQTSLNPSTVTIPVRNPQNYVPSGTFVKAIMLGGADANASVTGQSSTNPMLFRILDNGTMPNGYRAKLKGCVATASVYGDVSSERGEIRLDRLSCTRKNGQIIELPVQGTVFGPGGKNGVRGIVVMRNGQILADAGISGLAAGLGNVAQQASTTTSTSPLGSTQTVNPSQLGLNVAGSGLSSAMGQLSQYYIQRAEQYHPVIELSAGTPVDLVFLKGFYYDDTLNTNPPTATTTQVTTTTPTTTNNMPPFVQQAVIGQMNQPQTATTTTGGSH
jgi:conjugal transfer pilus assembly protein TraB